MEYNIYGGPYYFQDEILQLTLMGNILLHEAIWGKKCYLKDNLSNTDKEALDYKLSAEIDDHLYNVQNIYQNRAQAFWMNLQDFLLQQTTLEENIKRLNKFFDLIASPELLKKYQYYSGESVSFDDAKKKLIEIQKNIRIAIQSQPREKRVLLLKILMPILTTTIKKEIYGERINSDYRTVFFYNRIYLF